MLCKCNHYKIRLSQKSFKMIQCCFFQWDPQQSLDTQNIGCTSTTEIQKNIIFIQFAVISVQITRNKIQDYILRYHKMDGLLYFKLIGSNKRFRQHLSYIFSHKLKTLLNQALAKITSMLTDTNMLPYHKLMPSQIYICQKVNCKAFWIFFGLCQFRFNNFPNFSSCIKLFIM
ncbi:unnamed protein product (macronuclear) [Paramecium tetraurelia]|uniref:Transmembrane protein n=1 Tax=Paramecium tetraurelia TaxID=5888 RepID=A0C3X7_PARTE|nr:uncharacterized protein GSPATT00034973001 [Paramecium tetraurelia]CAK65494.1 unnamed protein product [Paramecium tetraurelia]|eukprot:XP_001432891.1 hypothetical protein (macronuclear) [Paramecium tetraurelia strain d4-2]